MSIYRDKDSRLKEVMEIKRIKEIILLAGAYISVCIGSGFATGQELLQFFTAHGLKSFVIAFVCMVIMGYCGAKLMAIGYHMNFEYSNDIFEYLFGYRVGKVFKLIIPVFCLCSFIVMISGAGTSINEYYGISKQVGILVMAVLSLISVIMGMNKVIGILGKIGPVVIVVVISISVITIYNNQGHLLDMPKLDYASHLTKPIDSCWISAIVYSGLNIVLSTPFLVRAGAGAKSVSSCTWAGIIGGVVYVIAAMFINIALLSNIEVLSAMEIPTLAMANLISPIVGMIFSIILIAEIYTTAAPLLWNVCNSCAEEKTFKFNRIAIGCTILGLFGGMLPFSALVNSMYPILGAIGVIVILALVVKRT